MVLALVAALGSTGPALALLGCDDDEAPKPPPPPPEVAVAMHAHFGRPGATLGMALRLVHNAADAKGADAVSILSEATGLEPAVVGLADLLKPADVLLVDSGGERHVLLSMSAVPDVAASLPEGMTMAPAAEGELPRLLGADGKTRCVLAEERLWCTAARGEALTGLARASQPLVAKWARDHTDAVIEIEGEALRGVVWPAVRSDVAIVTSRLAARAARGVDGPLATWLTALGDRSPEPVLALIERAVLRLRLDGGQARIEARVDFDAGSKSALGEAIVGLYGSTPLASALGHLPEEPHGLVVRADAGLGDGVVLGEVASKAAASDALAALKGTLLPGLVAGVSWVGAERVLVEAQRSRDPEATKKALAALAVTSEGLAIRPSGKGLAIEVGGRKAHLALVEDVVVVASGAGALDDARLAGAIPGARAQPKGLAAALAPYAVGLGLVPSGLTRAGTGAGALQIGFRVTEKSPKSVRGALTIRADRAAIVELTQLLRLGRAKRPDPALVVDDAGEVDGDRRGAAP